jgi:hypothetical protein
VMKASWSATAGAASAIPSPSAAMPAITNFFMLISFAPMCAHMPLPAAQYGRSLWESAPYGSNIGVAVNSLQIQISSE